MVAIVILLFLSINSARIFSDVLIGDDSRSQNGRILDFSQKKIDVGDVVQGDKGNATFTIRNVSDVTVQNIDVDPSCGCIVVKNVLSNLGQGEETDVEIEVDTMGLRGRRKVGLLVHYSVEGVEKREVVSVIVNALPFVTFEPKQVQLRCADSPEGLVKSQDVTFKTGLDSGFEIMGISSSHPSIRAKEAVQLEQGAEQHSRHSLTVTCDCQHWRKLTVRQQANEAAEIVVITNIDTEPRLIIPVYVNK